MISYYDLLGMLKTNSHPSKVKLYLCNKSALYVYDNENNCYLLKDLRKENINSFRFYMNECLTDKQFFDNIIKIKK